MTSSLRTVVVLLFALGAGGCEKPSEENCRKALANVRTLYKTDNADQHNDVAGDVRRCVGGSSKKAVECAMNAKTLAELESCNFGKKNK